MITITLRPFCRLSLPIGLDELRVVVDNDPRAEVVLTISKVLVGLGDSNPSTQLQTIDW